MSTGLSADERFRQYLDKYVDLVSALATHANMAEGEGKRAFLRYVFLLKGYHLQNSVYDFVSLLEEMAQAVDYYIMKPNTEQPVEVVVPEQCDIQRWLAWFEDYLKAAASVLDTVVLDDQKIDFELLLAQAKKELYEQLNPELYAKLLAQIKEELREYLKENLTETLTAYINEVLKPELSRILGEDIHDQLYEELYEELYERLYSALYVPDPEEEAFVPQI